MLDSGRGAHEGGLFFHAAHPVACPANGQKLVTVSVSSIAAGVGNHIKAGDAIAMYCYKDDNAVLYNELSELKVYSIENDEAIALDEAGNDKDSKNIASTITLIVNDAQAQKLIFAEYAGKLHAAFVKRGVAE